MGSTATSKAVKKTPTTVKKDSGKKKSVRKTAPKKAKSRATPVKKKATARKKVATPKKATRKKTVGKKTAVKKKAPRKKAATKAGTRSVHAPDRHADVTAVARTTSNASNTTATDAVQEDEKSLSWMAAQAASALKAVKANQNARAQDLLAKAEITPATPVKPGEVTSTPVEPDPSEAGKGTKPGKEKSEKTKVKKATKPALETTRKDTQPEKTTEPVKAGTKQDTQTDKAPASVKAAAKPVVKKPPAVAPTEQKTPGTAAPIKPEAMKAVAAVLAEATEDGGEQQPDTPPAHVIAATPTATGRRRSVRPLLLTGIIVLVGILGARAWLSDDDNTDIAVIQNTTGTEQLSPVTADPQIPEVTVKPAVKPATDAAQADRWSPATMPAWPEPADTRQTLQTDKSTSPTTSVTETKIIDTQQQQVMMQTIEPASPETLVDETVGTDTRQQQTKTQTTAAAPKTVSPTAPRPGYIAPAYGYYPQQPVRQRPYYYQQTYSRPAYSQ
jgi:hypothetical protein